MDWDFCRYFIAVAEAGDYTGAARRLRSSHPTVSRKIAALEAQLGTRLFARTTEGLALTAQGRRFREQAEAMAAAASRAEAAVTARGAAARGIVKLSIGPTLAAHWLMPRMSAFLDSRRHIELELITHPFPVSVRRREADLVLRVFEAGDENLTGRKIGRLGVGFYASRDYAARRGLPEHRHDWRHHSVIGFADKATNTELGRWSDHVARHANVVMRCSSQSDMLAAARAGIGISVMSCFVGDSFADLVRVAPQKLAGLSDIWLLAHPDLVGLPAMREVIGFVTTSARADREMLRGG
ncbi:LysR family transcriptional regulator [Bradyrhizobium sp. LHD-71]|uniref:LysR family transcriptional regulator n=1 Tax=Bradyrhizobium sp. LHD-71 TaxID=3072141 RepID=UPI00280E0A48|nr:LysR family transcriptional regulator [Bradyrhizobium sp. LHD-71]MDQ8726143.1 LysR family transcriptional regulator [Bradyrhizobium sp. LHD-71]